MLPSGPMRLALDMAREESLNDEVLVEQLESDPRLRYGVLIGANLTLFGGKRAIKTVRQALGQLGRSKCQSMLWLLALSDFMRAWLPLPERGRLRLWKHSLLTAVIAHQLLRESGIERAAEGLPAGMAHDAGHLLMASPAPRLGIVWHEEHEQLAERDAAHKASSLAPAGMDAGSAEGAHAARPPLAPERDHARLGAALLELWGAPDSLIAAALHHHQPAIAPAALRPVVIGVRLADLLAEHIDRDRPQRPLCLSTDAAWQELAALEPWNVVPDLHHRAIELLPESLLTAEHLANLLGD